MGCTLQLSRRAKGGVEHDCGLSNHVQLARHACPGARDAHRRSRFGSEADVLAPMLNQGPPANTVDDILPGSLCIIRQYPLLQRPSAGSAPAQPARPLAASHDRPLPTFHSVGHAHPLVRPRHACARRLPLADARARRHGLDTGVHWASPSTPVRPERQSKVWLYSSPRVCLFFSPSSSVPFQYLVPFYHSFHHSVYHGFCS